MVDVDGVSWNGESGEDSSGSSCREFETPEEGGFKGANCSFLGIGLGEDCGDMEALEGTVMRPEFWGHSSLKVIKLLLNKKLQTESFTVAQHGSSLDDDCLDDSRISTAGSSERA